MQFLDTCNIAKKINVYLFDECKLATVSLIPLLAQIPLSFSRFPTHDVPGLDSCSLSICVVVIRAAFPQSCTNIAASANAMRLHWCFSSALSQSPTCDFGAMVLCDNGVSPCYLRDVLSQYLKGYTVPPYTAIFPPTQHSPHASETMG